MEESDELKELISRFETSLSDGATHFFDLDDFETIIDYYLDFGLTQKARTALHHAFRIYPGSSALCLKRAQILAYQNKRERALEILSEMEVTDPDNREINLTKAHIYSQMQQHDKSIEEYIKAAEDTEQDQEDICISIAFEHENKGDFTGALSYLHKALEINPDNESVVYEMSYCYEMLEMPEASLPYFHAYLDRHPFSTLAWFNLGVTLSQMERWGDAIEAYDYVLAIDESFASAYFNKANALGGLGLYEKAIQTYYETFGHEDPDHLTWYYIGECYEKMEKYREAIDHYLKSVSLNDKYADAWMGIGSCYHRLENHSLAAQYLKISISKEPKNPEGWYMLGDVSRDRQDFEKAEECYQMVASLDPEREDIWIDLHDLYFTNDRPLQSLERIEEGLTRFPDNAPMLYRRIVSLYFKGMQRDAILLLEALYPRFPKEASVMFELAPGLHMVNEITRIVPHS